MSVNTGLMTPSTGYKINLKVNNIPFDFSETTYLFTVQDSIFNFYPKAKIYFNDSHGLHNEFLSFINGTKVEILFGHDNDFFKVPFGVVRNGIPNQSNPDSIGGQTETSLIHYNYFEQERICSSFNSEISKIIQNKLQNYNFNSLNISPTLNKGIWYQPYINNTEFIQEHLLPYSYSPGNEKTPYYSFIDLNNDYYFQSFKSLYKDQNPVGTIVLNIGGGTPDDLSSQAGYNISPYSSPIFDIRDSINRKMFKLDKNALLQTINENITSYILEPDKVVPMRFDTSLSTGINNLIPEDVIDESTKNNNLGLTIFGARELFHLDKLIIFCNFNPQFRSGKVVEVQVPTIENKKVELSVRASGKYIIESAYHQWNGRHAVSTLVVSRQSVKQYPGSLAKRDTVGKI